MSPAPRSMFDRWRAHAGWNGRVHDMACTGSTTTSGGISNTGQMRRQCAGRIRERRRHSLLASTSSPGRQPRNLLPVPDGATAWPGRPLTQTIGWGQADDLAAGQDDWRQQLQTNGFIDGVVRRWVDRDGQQIEVALLRFPDGDSPWKVFESIVNYCTTGDVWTTQSGKMGALFATRYPDDQGHFLQMGANYAGDVMIKIRVGGTKTVDNAVVATMLQAQSTALG